jgi:hypothetical protein
LLLRQPLGRGAGSLSREQGAGGDVCFRKPSSSGLPHRALSTPPKDSFHVSSTSSTPSRAACPVLCRGPARTTILRSVRGDALVLDRRGGEDEPRGRARRRRGRRFSIAAPVIPPPHGLSPGLLRHCAPACRTLRSHDICRSMPTPLFHLSCVAAPAKALVRFLQARAQQRHRSAATCGCHVTSQPRR